MSGSCRRTARTPASTPCHPSCRTRPPARRGRTVGRGARKEQWWVSALERHNLNGRVQRGVVVAVAVAERAARTDPAPAAAVDAAAGRRRVPVDAHPVPEAAQDLRARLTVDVRGLDRRVELRVVRVARIPLVRGQKRGKVIEQLRNAVGVDLRAPLPPRRVEPVDLDPGIAATDQLVDPVPVEIGQPDRRILRRIAPAARVGPRRHREHRPAVAGIAVVEARARGTGRKRRHKRQPSHGQQQRRDDEPRSDGPRDTRSPGTGERVGGDDVRQ